jgi:transmembrane sensor
MSTERTRQIEDAASFWLTARQSADWSDTDQRALDAWLDESAAHQVAFLRLELGWEEAGRLKALEAGIAGDEPPPPGQWQLTPFFSESAEPEPVDGAKGATPCEEPVRTDATPSRAGAGARRRATYLAIAASLVLAAILGGLMWPQGDVYRTPVGGSSSLRMLDGSNLTLNTNSQVQIKVSDKERRIDLERGEVFIQVAKDPVRPFVVRAGDKQIIAIGTQFSVRRDGDDVGVVVTEGAVRVEDASSAKALQAGSVARVTQAGILVQHRSVPEAEEALSWRSGVLNFRDTTLEQAVREFNRYNVRQLEVEDPEIGHLKIEGNFRSTNVEGFARLLEDIYPVTVESRGDESFVIRPRKSS